MVGCLGTIILFLGFVTWIILSINWGEYFTPTIICLVVFSPLLYAVDKYNTLVDRVKNTDNELKRQKESFEQQLSNKEYEIAQETRKRITLELSQKRLKLSHDIENFEKYRNAKSKELQEKEKLLILSKAVSVKNFPIIADMFTDYQLAYDEYIEHYLRYKRPPARTAADNVKLLRQQKKEILAHLYAYKWELKYIKDLIPWIEDIEDEVIVPTNQDYEVNPNIDPATRWLTPEDYNNLPTVEKYQRALNHYMRRKKNSWEAGQEYERYIGYLYEKAGYQVTYYGSEKGLEDLGRDLICKLNNITLVIQCKRWATNKTIHEKHINQLFGTTVMYYLTDINPSGNVADFYKALENKVIIPVFYSTTGYSTTSQQFAKTLGVVCKTKLLGKYPIIKCNINPATQERIYHLPFDQQYDKCKIIPSQGECYAATVQEAENKGFRRAKRWHGKV